MKELYVMIKKELREIMRTKNGMILGITLLFFAIADPVILKMTPMLLKEFSGVDMSEFIVLSHKAAVVNFYGDVYQIFTIVFVLILSNNWIKEVKEQTFVIPVLKGASIDKLFLSKVIAYSMVLSTLLIMGFGLNYYYAGVIFGFELELGLVVYMAILLSLFYGWCTMFILFISTFIRNQVIVALISLMTLFVGPFLFSLIKLTEITPFTLIDHASTLTYIPSDQIIVSGLSIIALTFAMYYAGVTIVKRKEIVKYR